MRCDHCRFCNPVKCSDDTVQYECRFNAPSSGFNGSGWNWPRVSAKDWCGKYELDRLMDRLYFRLTASETPEHEKAELREAIERRKVSR